MADRKKKGAEARQGNSKVVLLGATEKADRYLLCKTLAGELGVPFEEATRMLVQAPTEIFPSIPEQAAELFAEKLRRAGATVEVYALGLGNFCQAHPHKRARAKCKSCGSYICEIEILDAGKRLYCAGCFSAFRRRRLLRLAAVLLILAGAVAAWLAARPTLLRMIRFQTAERGVRVLVVCIADRMDKERSRVFHELAPAPGTSGGGGLQDVAEVFNREYARYTGRGGKFMTLEARGVYETIPEAPVPTRPGLAFLDFFRRMGDRHDVEYGGFDLVLYIFLTDQAALPPDADPQNLTIVSGRRGIYRFATDDSARRGQYLAGVAYALGRMLGGTPKRTPRGLPAYPDGYPDPARPQFQTTDEAEVLAGYAPDLVHGRRAVDDLAKLRVGPKSAWEFGWISTARVQQAYASLPGG